ncbi:MAG: tRNA (guanosine(37)-N1)-methyltransferase TrmD [Gammaproteobacteria bacterium]|nr:tRNA (guanosine(37)-N1)-methyltransferase TrmD [Gammaproteobacteria bacterium]
MRIDVITLFPELVSTMLDHGVVGRALRAKQVDLELTNPRDFADDANNRVDDRPYGGGPGMVLQYAPLSKALEHVKSQLDSSVKARVVYLSPQGQRLNQTAVRRLSQSENLVLMCGRYEGIDERFIEANIDEELSIGDYVISGGELAAMVLIDAMVRTLPGVLGDDQSAEQESFEHGLLDCPHYTRPESIDGSKVPEELLSGDHSKIATWRLKQALGRTYLRRPDMIEQQHLSDQEQQLLKEYLVEVKAKNER